MANKKNEQSQAQEQAQGQLENVSCETSSIQIDEKPTALLPIVAFAKSNGIAVNLDRKDFLLHSPNSDGKLSVHIDNSEVALAANVLDGVAHAAKSSVKALCVLLAYVERKGYYAKFGFKTTADFGESFTGLERKTILSYIAIGNTFFDEDMRPVKPFVNDVSVAHLNQIRATVIDNKYVYGGKMDFSFFQAYFATCAEIDGTISSVSRLNDFLSGARKNYIDKRFLDVERKSFIVDEKDNRFPEYEELTEVDDTTNVKSSNSKVDNDKSKGRGTPTGDNSFVEISPLEKAITALTDSLQFFTTRYSDDEELGKMVIALQSYIAEKLQSEENTTESK